MHRHQIFNVFRGSSLGSAKYRGFFKSHGIDMDAYAIELTAGVHREWVHGAGRNWTAAWKRWTDDNPTRRHERFTSRPGE